MPHSYVWNEDSSFKFMEAFSLSDISQKIDCIKKDNFSNDVNEALNKFNDIIFTACNRSLRKKTRIGLKKKTSKQKWFDNDAYVMRKELIRRSNLYSKYPNDPHIRGSFFKFRKNYSRFCKNRKKEFKKSIISKIDNLYNNDPSEYWKLVKELREADEDTSDPSIKVSSDNWVSHFSKLFSVKNQFKAQNKHYEQLLLEAEKIKHLHN